MTRRIPERARRGAAELLFVVCLPVIVMSMVLGIDLAHAYGASVMLKQALDDACQEAIVRQEEIKFSADPAQFVCDEIVREALGRDGFIGQARVFYYEEQSPRSDRSAQDDERHIVVEVAAERTVGSAFGAGVSWPVTCSVVWTMKPYASYRVYRPRSGNWGRAYLVAFERQQSGDSTSSLRGRTDISRSALSAEARRALDDIA